MTDPYNGLPPGGKATTGGQPYEFKRRAMSKISTILGPTLYAEDADWLEENSPAYYQSVREAVTAGHTPDQIYTFYMQQSPHRQPLWLRVKHTAIYLSGDEAK